MEVNPRGGFIELRFDNISNANPGSVDLTNPGSNKTDGVAFPSTNIRLVIKRVIIERVSGTSLNATAYIQDRATITKNTQIFWGIVNTAVNLSPFYDSGNIYVPLIIYNTTKPYFYINPLNATADHTYNVRIYFEVMG